MTGPSPPGEPTHYPYLDAVRGWAILCVFLVHTAGIVPNLSGSVSWIAARGVSGVQLFFVASALTLMLSHESRKGKDARPTLAFFVRRLLRIAPLFWLAAGFYVLWYGFGPRASAPAGIVPADVFATLTFTHGWRPEQINSVVPGGWSIAVEMSFYLLAPLIFQAARTPRGAAAVLFVTWAVAVAVADADLPTRFFPEADVFTRHSLLVYWLPNQLPVFAFGVVAYHFVRTPRPFWLYLVLLPPLALGGTPPVRSGALAALFVWALRVYPVPLLVNKVTRFIGTISFSAYLTHFAVIDVLRAAFGIGTKEGEVWYGRGAVADWIANPIVPLSGLSPASQFAILLAATATLTVAISTVTYYLVESPGISFGKRLLRRLGWAPRPTVASSPQSIQPPPATGTGGR